MIVAGCILSYLAAGLFAARYAYGWMRAKSIDGNMKRHPSLYPTVEKSEAEWRSFDRAGAMFLAFLVLAGWPAVAVLSLAAWQFARFLDGTARLSQAEYQERLTARDRRIAELEREAGIR